MRVPFKCFFETCNEHEVEISSGDDDSRSLINQVVLRNM